MRVAKRLRAWAAAADEREDEVDLAFPKKAGRKPVTVARTSGTTSQKALAETGAMQHEYSIVSETCIATVVHSLLQTVLFKRST